MPADARSRRLSPDELRQLRWLLGNVVALLSLASVFFLSGGELPFAGAASAAALSSLLFPSLPARLSRALHLFAFPLVAAFFLWDLWTSAEWLPCLVRLDILLMAYRCLDYRGRREDLQLLLLGFLLLVVVGVLTVEFGFVALLALFAPCALALLHLTASAEDSLSGDGSDSGRDKTGARQAPAWLAGFRPGPLVARAFGRLRWRLVALGFLLFAGTAAATIVLFLAIPRFQLENGLFLERFFPRKARTGFSDTVRFGSVAEITLDDRLALTVDPGSPEPLPSSLYFRMLALDEYAQDGSFRLSSRARLELAASERNTSQLRGSARAAAGEEAPFWTFYLEAGVSRYLPLPGAFGFLRLRDPSLVQYDPRLRVVSLHSEPLVMTAYRLGSPLPGGFVPDPFFAARLRAAPHDPEGRPLGGARLCLELPVDAASQEELTRLLARWGLGEPRSAGDFARQVCERLAAGHRYSLSPRIPDGKGDPLVRWLASGQPGHCELFAGSFVLLARAASYPARLVVGFRGGSWNDYSQSLAVRNSDAHAWCELWDASSGAWLRVDPTPGAGIAGSGAAYQVRAAPSERGWSARLAGLRVAWYRHVVNFDRQDQAALVRDLRGLASSLTGWFAEKASAFRRASLKLFSGVDDGSAPVPVGRILLWSAASLVLLLLLRATATLLRFRRGRLGKEAAVRAEAGRWLLRFEAARERTASDAEEGRAVEAELLRLRYGAPSTWPEPAAVFRRAKRQTG